MALTDQFILGVVLQSDDRMSPGVSSASRSFGRLDASISRGVVAGLAFQRVATGLVGVGKDMIGFGVEAIRTFGGFEDRLLDVAKTTGASVEAVSALGELLQDLAPRLGSTQEELAGIAVVAGQLGLRGGQIFPFVEAVAGTALGAVDLSAEQAASTLGRLITLFGLTVDEAQNLGSSLLAVADQAATGEAALAEIVIRVGATARGFGLTAGETLGLSGVLRDFGIRAERAGTNLQNILEILAVDAPRVARAAGIDIKELSRLMREEPSRAILKVAEGFRQFRDDNTALSKAIRAAGFSGTFQRKIWKALTSDVEKLEAAMKFGNDEFIRSARIQEELAIRSKALSFQSNEVTQRFREFKTDVGRALGDVFKSFLVFVKPAAEFLANLSDEAKGVIGAFLGIAGAAAAVAGAVLLFTALGLTFALLGSAIVIALKVVAVIGLVVGAIVGMVAVISKVKVLSDFFSAIFETLRTAFVGVFEEIRTSFDGLVAAFGGMENLLNVVKVIAVVAFAPLIFALAGALLLVSGLIEVIGFLVTHFLDFISIMVKGIRNFGRFWGKVIGSIVGFFVDMFNGVVGIFTSIKNFIVGVFEGIGSVVSGIFNGILGVFKSVINVVIRGLNATLIPALNAILEIGTLGGLFGAFETPQVGAIPELRHGGIATRSQIVRVGEAGPEAIIPLRRLEDLFGNLISGLREVSGGGAGKLEISIPLMLDGKVLVEALADVNVEGALRRGERPIVTLRGVGSIG